MGKVGVIPTDTIYGIVGSAVNSKTVEKIYNLKKRAKDKPMIILISTIGDLEKFAVKFSKKQKEFLEKNWPNPLSVILKCDSEKFNYLHRGKKSLAFRMPKDEKLLEVLKKAGPLVAPSANIEGEKVAENINQAKKYFKNRIDFYVDIGELQSQSSTLIKLKLDGSYKILREGLYRFGQKV